MMIVKYSNAKLSLPIFSKNSIRNIDDHDLSINQMLKTLLDVCVCDTWLRIYGRDWNFSFQNDLPHQCYCILKFMFGLFTFFSRGLSLLKDVLHFKSNHLSNARHDQQATCNIMPIIILILISKCGLNHMLFVLSWSPQNSYIFGLFHKRILCFLHTRERSHAISCSGTARFIIETNHMWSQVQR